VEKERKHPHEDANAKETRLAMAVSMGLAGYPQLASSPQVHAAWVHSLKDFDSDAAVGAMQLLVLVARCRTPYVGDAISIADTIERYGYEPVRKAAIEWPRHVELTDINAVQGAPTPARWEQTVRAIKARDETPREGMALSDKLRHWCIDVHQEGTITLPTAALSDLADEAQALEKQLGVGLAELCVNQAKRMQPC
jgi:hypothetical protein